MLTIEQSNKLLDSYVQHKNQSAFDRVITGHIYLAEMIARKYKNSGEVDDLAGQGMEALIHALKRWDKSRGAFIPFAITMIKQELWKYIFSNRRSITKNNLNSDDRKFKNGLARMENPTHDDIVKLGQECGMDSHRALSNYHFLTAKDSSIDKPLRFGSSTSSYTLADTMMDDSPLPDEIMIKSEQFDEFKSIYDIMKNNEILSARQIELMDFVLDQISRDEDINFSDFAEIKGLSKQRASQLFHQSIERIQKGINDEIWAMNQDQLDNYRMNNGPYNRNKIPIIVIMKDGTMLEFPSKQRFTEHLGLSSSHVISLWMKNDRIPDQYGIQEIRLKNES